MNKVFCVHPKIYSVETLLDYLHLDHIDNLIWDDSTPDILFASEWIYYQRTYFSRFCKMYNSAKVRILLAFEAISPDWNIFDYAVGFDNHHQNGDRFIRIMSPLDMFNKWVTIRENEIKTIQQARDELISKEGFCNFLYSNPEAHPTRDRLFFEISKYKRVDSLGCHLNNVSQEGTGFAGHTMECVPMKRRYKFSIASENAAYPGYTSEKIFTSLAAHTIPIYFGNPDILEDVNADAFINVNDFNSMDSLVKYIKEVDNNDELWCKYVSAPWFTKEQETYHIQRTVNYENRLSKILTKPEERLCIGTHSDIYRRHFLTEAFPLDRTLTQKMINKCHKLANKIL